MEICNINFNRKYLYILPTQRSIPEDSNFHTRSRENLTSRLTGILTALETQDFRGFTEVLQTNVNIVPPEW
jgi:hypothetical protein